jgi:formate C-acetyltransferase
LPICSPTWSGAESEATIRLREELAEHRRALLQMQEMAAKYGCDISRPARNAGSGTVGLFCYLAAVKSQNGGAMSLGRTAIVPRYLH